MLLLLLSLFAVLLLLSLGGGGCERASGSARATAAHPNFLYKKSPFYLHVFAGPLTLHNNSSREAAFLSPLDTDYFVKANEGVGEPARQATSRICSLLGIQPTG